MSFKKRDPLVTGKVRLPWRLTDPCPCGVGTAFANCCRQADGNIYKAVALPIPPVPVTGHKRDNCYMSWTHDCSAGGSREHFISQSVLTLIGGGHVRVDGLPWLPEGEAKALPVNALAANILCARHNAAMSPLDTMAGKFFGAIMSIYDDLGNGTTLSRKPRWFLFSGEELELWLLKTAFGLFHSGNVAKNRNALRDEQAINQTIIRAFHGAVISPPCGIYVLKDELEHRGPRKTMNFAPLSSDNNERMVGLRLGFMDMTLAILLDPNTVYNEAFVSANAYRPSYVIFRNRRRTHTMALTWPPGVSKNAVLFDGVGPVREG